MQHRERHRAGRTGWLRAAVLGANDGLLSTAGLIVGVAASHAMRSDILIAGVAGLVAGSMSMAAGEYVSVSTQADTEKADLEKERRELAADVESERNELAMIYVRRGVEAQLARQVAEQLMARDALGAHAHDELGITATLRARPVQAAITSAAAFASGAAVPLVAVMAAPQMATTPVVAVTSIVSLALLGAVAARAGGARAGVGAARVTFWGALAMAAAAGVGSLFGTSA